MGTRTPDDAGRTGAAPSGSEAPGAQEPADGEVTAAEAAEAGGGAPGASADAAAGESADSGAPEPVRRFVWLRRHRWAAAGVVAVVVAAGVTVPLAVADGGTPCRRVPAATGALADDPAAATRALDPGDDLNRLSAARRLLDHPHVCADGTRVLGRVITAATVARTGSTPHTLAQARSAYAVAAAYTYDGVPRGLAPALARMLADYIGDVVRDTDDLGLHSSAPATTVEKERRHTGEREELGLLPAPHDAHVSFGYRAAGAPRPVIHEMVEQLVTDPEAFAILHDATRAYLAFHLERMPREGLVTSSSSDADEEENWGFEEAAGFMGTLQGMRTSAAEDGRIPDLGAFDRSVRAHLHGSYRPQGHPVTSPAPGASVAVRRADGPLHGDPFEARTELSAVLDAWARTWHVPPQRLAQMQWIMESTYVEDAYISVSQAGR